ncbi:MAG: hypothetical protein M1378_13150 [Bacteroidetes bacterium]|nr:hypothetical protein [Bacteroidota bacterium]
MKSRPLFGTLILTLVLVADNGSRKGKPTNYDILNSQVDTLAATVIGVLAHEHGRSVYVKTGTRAVDNFVRQRLLQNLLRDKFRVMNDTASSSVVRVLVPLVEVNYSEPVTSHIFGSSDVIRTLRSEYDVEVSDSARVTFARAFTMAFRDTVSENEIPDLEKGSYDFLHGRLEEKNFLDTVFQPVLFVASAAVIVYLFFTLRGS